MAIERVYNFSAGPSMLPEYALKKAADEMLAYKDAGMSVMEMSHRSKPYEAIIEEAEALLREIMEIPENYKVLFLQGGASTQFAMVPMNLLTKNKKADYIITGQFAKKAAEECEKYGTVNRVASSADKTFSYIPKVEKSAFDPEADYCHITYNNTIFGTRFTSIPDTGNVPLVADTSSIILSEKIDVSKFGLLYAGAQKNMGPAGLTVVIIRDDLVGEPLLGTPTMLTYKTHVENGSMYNTPPTYSIYMCKLVLEWLRDLGGISVMEKMNREKADLLYAFLDSSKLFKTPVEKEDRSLMNVTFVTGDKECDAAFVKAAAAEGLVNLKGHRSVGGMRASIYNAMPIEGVKKLVAFMQKFEENNQ